MKFVATAGHEISGNKKRKMSLFECPSCKVNVVRPHDNGGRTKTCGAKGCKDNGCTTHGLSNKPVYICWRNMHQRCTNPKAHGYKYYGGKGIKHPPSWDTFDGFLADMGAGYEEGMSIDRIDPALDYSVDNCQWISMHENRIKDQIKEVTQHTLEGVFVASYCSTAEAGRQTGLLAQSIARAARGERRQAHGFVWEYV